MWPPRPFRPARHLRILGSRHPEERLLSRGSNGGWRLRRLMHEEVAGGADEAD